MTLLDNIIESALAVYPMQKEYRFHPERRFRFDYALPDYKIAIEIQGGTWTRGKHVRGKGYQDDCEKLNLAQTMGWRVLWYTPQMIEKDLAAFINSVDKLVQGEIA